MNVCFFTKVSPTFYSTNWPQFYRRPMQPFFHSFKHFLFSSKFQILIKALRWLRPRLWDLRRRLRDKKLKLYGLAKCPMRKSSKSNVTFFTNQYMVVEFRFVCNSYCYMRCFAFYLEISIFTSFDEWRIVSDFTKVKEQLSIQNEAARLHEGSLKWGLQGHSKPIWNPF